MSQLTTVLVNGRGVAFYPPPAHAKDLLWVDGMQLLCAFMPQVMAETFFRGVRQLEKGNGYQAVRNGDAIATIISHTVAEGMLASYDVYCGHSFNDGPAAEEYCRACAVVLQEHWGMSAVAMLAMFANDATPPDGGAAA